MKVYRLVNSKYDPITIGENLTRTSDHSYQKYGEGMYFAASRADALNFAKAQHGHAYTHLLTCRIEEASQDDFVDLRREQNCLATSEFRTLPMKKRAPEYCRQQQKKGLIWSSIAGKDTLAWTEVCLYPEHILDGVVIEAAEKLRSPMAHTSSTNEHESFPAPGIMRLPVSGFPQEIMMANTFQGFTADSFLFFQELACHNQKSWFDANRDRYDQHVVGTFRGLLETLTPTLLKLNPHFEVGGKTNGNFSRINRDIRFSKDKSPYKSNYYLYIYDGRYDRGHTGRLYVGLSADCVTVGFSIYGSWRGPKGALETVFRKRVAAHQEIFETLLARLVRARRYETYWHREEKGEWAQHPGLPRREEDWQTLHAWVVRKVFLPNSWGLGTPAFAGVVERVFAELYPLVIFSSVVAPKWQAEIKTALK